MLSLSPFAPVQYFEQVRPVPSVNRGAERAFTPAEREAAPARKRDGGARTPDAQEQPLSGFGASATLLSSALLTELSRQQGRSAASEQQDEAVRDDRDELLDRAPVDKKRQRKSTERASTTAADSGFSATVTKAAKSGVSVAADTPMSGLTDGAPAPSAANDSAMQEDRGQTLVRLQRAKAVYTQGQIASGSYAFAQSAEVFQMVA